LGLLGGLSTGQLMLPAPHGRKAIRVHDMAQDDAGDCQMVDFGRLEVYLPCDVNKLSGDSIHNARPGEQMTVFAWVPTLRVKTCCVN